MQITHSLFELQDKDGRERSEKIVSKIFFLQVIDMIYVFELSYLGRHDESIETQQVLSGVSLREKLMFTLIGVSCLCESRNSLFDCYEARLSNSYSIVMSF